MPIINLLTLILSAQAVIGTGYTYFRHDRKLKQQEALLNRIRLEDARVHEENKIQARIRGIIPVTTKDRTT